jgi:imidazolonepropionase-like amidohydrolase
MRFAIPIVMLTALHGLVALPASGQEVVSIEGATVHTVSGEVIDGGTVLIRDGRIAAVGRDVAVPQGARRIDATGRVVTPGFFESKTNLGLAEVGLAPGTQDFLRVAEHHVAAAFSAAEGLNPHSIVFGVTRLSGVTTAVSQPGTAGISAPGGPVHLISGQGAVIDLGDDGDLDRVLVRSPVAMFAFLGESSQGAGGGTRGGAIQRLRQILDDVRLFRDARDEFERGALRTLALDRPDLEALVPVVEGELPLAVTVHRSSDILTALNIAEEFGLRLVISGGSEAWMVASALAHADVPVVTKVLSNLPATFEQLGARFDNAALLRANGVRVAITSADTHNARNLRFEAGNAVTHGMPWAEALRAVTLTPAEIWGVEQDYGSIEVGKVANVVIWDGDPFEFLTRTTHVFIQGREMPRTSRELELQERYRSAR